MHTTNTSKYVIVGPCTHLKRTFQCYSFDLILIMTVNEKEVHKTESEVSDILS